jgi:hypothetical protein
VGDGHNPRLSQYSKFAERENKLFRSFANPARCERYEALLSSEKGRMKIRRSLDHFRDLDLRYCKKLAGAEHS